MNKLEKIGDIDAVNPEVFVLRGNHLNNTVTFSAYVNLEFNTNTLKMVVTCPRPATDIIEGIKSATARGVQDE